ncbi:terpene synthase family protein [Streptomyces sp. NPDC028635]|uniref:terpene synthase family protein n=1 Tax=Streptomyces sp. NPDC028635 TaxID=3154800 RepID=UPI00340A25EC
MDFYIPFELRVNPETAQARTRHEAWVKSSGLLPGPEFYGLYEAWDFPKLVSYTYPTATGARLDLAMNMIGLSFVWDDQHERLCQRDRVRAVAHSREIMSIFHQPLERFTGPEVATTVRLWAQLWRELSEGMSSSWWCRAAQGWEWMAASFPQQARDHARPVPGLRHYSQVRRGVAGVEPTFASLEAIWGCEVPALAFHSPQVRLMHDAIVWATIWCNDVYSLEKEEADGDVDNIVLVLENARSCSRREAVDEVVSMVKEESCTSEGGERWIYGPPLKRRSGWSRPGPAPSPWRCWPGSGPPGCRPPAAGPGRAGRAGVSGTRPWGHSTGSG